MDLAFATLIATGIAFYLVILFIEIKLTREIQELEEQDE